MASPQHQQILDAPADPQLASPLFKTLPPEVRLEIFSHALTDYPDPAPDRAYSATTCYTRPAYLSPRKNDTALLRTCRAAYAECWFLPFLLCEQVHWAVGNRDRAPPGYDFYRQLPRLAATLRRIRAQQGREFEVGSLHVFAQMFMIEEGKLRRLLDTPELRPRVLTLTIRHADWWFWENDEPLRFEGDWIQGVGEVLPSSVGEINIELETVERKKGQLDEIARQMMDKWFFKRVDGAVLYAASKTVSRWKGTSRWHSHRWVRDESAEGVIDYYIVTVTFRPESVLQRRGIEVSAKARENAIDESDGRLASGQLKLHNPEWQPMASATPFILEPPPPVDENAPRLNGRRSRIMDRPRWWR